MNLFCYYVLAMPISFGAAFGLGWQLKGLWLGVALALGLVAAIEGWFLVRTDWEKAVEVCFGYFFLEHLVSSRRSLTYNVIKGSTGSKCSRIIYHLSMI